MNLKMAKRSALAAVGLLTLDGEETAGSYNLQNDRLIRLSYWADIAQKELAIAAAPIKKTVQVVTGLPENLISEILSEIRCVKTYTGGTVQISAQGAQSFYIEVDGPCNIDVFVGDVLTNSYSISQKPKSFFSVKDIIPNTGGVEVRIVLSGKYPYHYRNEALYSQIYASADDVPDYAEYIEFDSRFSDIYRVLSSDITFHGNCDLPASWYFEGGKLYLENTREGFWSVAYLAQPSDIDDNTPDEYEFEIPAYAHPAIVMKMAYGVCVDIGFTNSSYAVFKNEHAQLFNAIAPQERYTFRPIENAY